MLLWLKERPEFTLVEQEILTRWVVMVSINLEYWGRIVLSTRYQRSELMEGRVPAGWEVSIGRMRNAVSAGRSWSRTVRLPLKISESECLPLSVCYFVIENVAFRSLSTVVDQLLPIAKATAGPIGRLALPRSLWPVLAGASDGSDVRLSALDLNVSMGPVPFALT